MFKNLRTTSIGNSLLNLLSVKQLDMNWGDWS